MRVEEFEFWGCSVFIEFRIPISIGERRKRACYWLPFCDTQPV